MAKVQVSDNAQEKVTFFKQDVIYQSLDNCKIVWCTRTQKDKLNGFTLKSVGEQGGSLHGIYLQESATGWKVFEGTLTISNEENENN